jgi:aryl-alcohol dehydrogenase
MEIRAAVLHRRGAGFTIETVTLCDPQADEVLVQIKAAGVCHTDVAVRDGDIPLPPVPCVLGHEGAGVVAKCGADVTDFGVGDHVVLSFASCGACAACGDGRRAQCANFAMVNLGGQRPDGSYTHHQQHTALNANFFGQSSFGTFAVVKARHLVTVAKDIPFQYLAPLGCGIQTGAGTVLNTLRPRPSESLVVFGAGAVGLSAIMAAKLSGCDPIIAVDIHAGRLSLAAELGATDLIDAQSDEDVVGRIRALTGTGAAFVVEASGSCEAMANAIECARGFGSVALVGVPKAGASIALDAQSLMTGVRVFAVIEGDSDPARFIPQLIEFHRQGLFPFDRLVTLYPFARINAAIADATSGGVIKAVLCMDDVPCREDPANATLCYTPGHNERWAAIDTTRNA